MSSMTTTTAGTGREEYLPDGPVAQRIADVTPFFPYKGIPRFYDIGGFLKHPEIFALVIEVLAERYKDQNIDKVRLKDHIIMSCCL
jgi:hypothetical protein